MKNHRFFNRQICACGPKFAGYEKGMVINMYKTGSIFAVLSSICHLAMGGIVILQPVIFQDANVNLFLNTMSKNSTLFVLFYLLIGLSAIFGLGVVEQITEFLKVKDYEIVKWAQRLAYVGFAVLAVAYFKVLTVKPYMAAVYLTATETEKEIILTMDPYISFSPNGIVIYGFVGVWVALISILAIKKKSYSLPGNVIGVIMGIILISVTIPNLPPLFAVILNTAKGVISFLWFGLLGMAMMKNKEEHHS